MKQNKELLIPYNKIVEKLENAYLVKGLKFDEKISKALLTLIKEDLEDKKITVDDLFQGIGKAARSKEFLTYGLIFELSKKPCDQCKGVGAVTSTTGYDAFCDCPAGTERRKHFAKPFSKF